MARLSIDEVRLMLKIAEARWVQTEELDHGDAFLARLDKLGLVTPGQMIVSAGGLQIGYRWVLSQAGRAHVAKCRRVDG